MGKAGKWILDFLIGKKEDNQKKKKKKQQKKITGSSSSSSFSDHSENLKLKWSFRKTSTKTSNLLLTHNLSKSVNSIHTIEAINHVAMAQQRKPPSTVQNVAATMIQSAYRSHLARKALHALRALVKIQALVRGHLVRKQTAATLKSLQALMAIQVRARASRIQLLEEDEELSERRRSKHLVNSNLEQVYKERIKVNLNENSMPYKSKSGHISRSQIEQIENEQDAYCRRNLSVPRRQLQYKNQSSMESNTSEYYILVSKSTPETTLYSMDQPRHSDFVPDDYLLYPNYMAKTESSRAKVRSQSEPKQRPCSNARMKSKQIGTADRININDQIQNSVKNLKHNGYENHNHPWFMKLYQFKKMSKNQDADSTSSKFSYPDD